MQRREQPGERRDCEAGAQPGAAQSLPALSRRFGRRALTHTSLMLVPVVAVASVVGARGLLTGETDIWIAIGSLVGMALAVAGVVVGSVRLRTAEAALLATADDLDRRSRARASELARANAELARVGRQRSEFFASMSHELRTPLNGILGFSRVLLDDLDGELTPEQREDVAQILASGQGLLSIVNDVLDFSKLEAGRITLRREPVQVRTVADDVLGRVQPLAAEKGLTLVNQVPADLPPALADDNRVLQVLLNLVANAIKFTDAGSVTVSGDVRDGEVHLAVADTGMGIAAEAHELIFEPFRQADQRDTRRHGGTGLGLSICRQLVVGMGGQIWLESELGQGTTVHLTLPAAEHEPADNGTTPFAATPIALAVVGAGEHVAALTRECEREGLTPVVVDGGSGLRDALARRYPGLALLDLTLPRAAGWQAFHTLRTDPGGREIPTVLYAGNGVQSFSLAAGPTDCLLHPAIATDLIARLDDLIESRPSASSRAGPRTVLLATADEVVGGPVAGLLERAGYDVCRAESVTAALALLRTHRFVALVLDLLVPGGSLSMLAELRAGGPTGAMPVLLVCPSMLSPVQQRTLYEDVVDVVRRRGGDGPPAAGAIRRALAERQGSATGTGSR